MSTIHTQETQTHENPTEAPWNEVHSESSEEHKSLARRTIDSSADTINRAKANVASTTSSLMDKAGEQYRQTSAAAKRGYEQLSEQASQAYSKSKTEVQRSFNAHPLAYMAGALVAGVAVGLVLPRLKKEKETLATAGKKIQEKTQQIGDKARAAATSARDAAKRSIEQRGLDPDSVTEDLKGVGNDSVEAAKDEFAK